MASAATTSLPGSSMYVRGPVDRARAGVATHTRGAPAWQQFAGAFRGRRPGRKHIVHQQNFASLDAFARRNLERSADLLACRSSAFSDTCDSAKRTRSSAVTSSVSRRPIDSSMPRWAARAISSAWLRIRPRAHAQLVHRHGNHQQLSDIDIALVAGRLER